jgi:ubiquinone/menaquinone biosynthesis C-methylase UbiE
METKSQAVDFGAITERQQQMWASGDFNEMARQVMSVSEDLIRAADPHAGQRVLDVACGSGNAALAAARRYAEVTGIDYVPSLIERAKMRAAAEGTKIDFRVADAQDLPFEDNTFDVVTSVFGVMFAPDQEKAAAELLRVTRPGGRIALACWPAEGFVGEFFVTQSKHVPPPPGTKAPLRWGTDAGLTELLGPGAKIRTERRSVFQYYRSVDHALEMFRTYFGPTYKAFQTLDAQGQKALSDDLSALFTRNNKATDGTLILEAQYSQSISTKG